MHSIFNRYLVVVAVFAAAVSNAANAGGIDRISAPTTLPTHSIPRTDIGERFNGCLSNIACATQRFEFIQRNLGIHTNITNDTEANAQSRERYAQ